MVWCYFVISLIVWAEIVVGTIDDGWSDSADKLGSTLCSFLSSRKQLTHSQNIGKCPELICKRNSWDAAFVTSRPSLPHRVVLSYSASGFGNMLWMNTVAFLIAEQFDAPLLVDIEPPELYMYEGHIAPNTEPGIGTMQRVLPREMWYWNLPADDPIRRLCDSEPFVIRDRKTDFSNKTLMSSFPQQMHDLINDASPRCIKLVGFYQNLPLCNNEVKDLWAARLLAAVQTAHPDDYPGENDISIYLRCSRHYHRHSKYWYEAILNRTSFEHVWLFQSPECRAPSPNDITGAVQIMLHERFSVKM